MQHSVIDTKSLGEAMNRYGPTAARNVSTEPIRLKTTTVDCHAHVFVAEAAKYLAPHHNPAALPFGKYSSEETRQTNKRQDEDRMVALTDPADRNRVLDTQGIDMQVVAPAPNQSYYEAPREHAAKVSRMVNEGVAAFVATDPKRFAGLGTIPLQDPATAVTELDHVMRNLGFKGVQILTNVNGAELSSPQFEPVWAKASELGAVMMLHPLGFTDAQRFGSYYFTNVIGNPLDTTVALHHLIFGGVLERHPELKVFSVHGGGFLPAYSGRIDHAWGARRDANASLPKRPTDYLRKIYFDTTVFTPHQLEYLVRQFGEDHIMMGTDYPYDMGEYYPIEHVVSVQSFTDAQRAAVAAGQLCDCSISRADATRSLGRPIEKAGSGGRRNRGERHEHCRRGKGPRRPDEQNDGRTMMTREWGMIKGMAGCALAGLLALAPASGGAQEMQELNVLLPNERTTVFYGVFLARDLGYFEDEGIKVNLLSSATTVPYVAFLSNGDADVAMLDAPQVFQAVNTGQPISVIYEDMQYAPESLFVSTDSEIQGLADLKGKTIGLASDRDRITVQVALKTVGITLDDVETVVVGDAGPTLANAFRNKTVAAVAGGASDLSAVEANGIPIRNITPPAVSENPANSFVVWTPRIEELRPAVSKFLRAWGKGMTAGALDMEVAAAMLKQEIPEQWEIPEVGMKLLNFTANKLHKPLTERRGDLQPAVWDRVQAPYIEIGEISKHLDPAMFLDDSFVEEANKYTDEEIKADLEEWKAAHPDLMQ